VQNRADFKEFRETADERYREIFSGGNLMNSLDFKTISPRHYSSTSPNPALICNGFLHLP